MTTASCSVTVQGDNILMKSQLELQNSGRYDKGRVNRNK